MTMKNPARSARGRFGAGNSGRPTRQPAAAIAEAEAAILDHFRENLTDTLDRLQKDHLPAYARLVGKVLSRQLRAPVMDVPPDDGFDEIPGAGPEDDAPAAPPMLNRPAVPVARARAPYLAQPPAADLSGALEDILGRHRSTVPSVFFEGATRLSRRLSAATLR